MIANRYEVLLLASLSGIVYAACRLAVLVCLPALAGQIWQRLLGPLLVSRWPGLGQSDDELRPSYMPTEPGQPRYSVSQR